MPRARSAPLLFFLLLCLASRLLDSLRALSASPAPHSPPPPAPAPAPCLRHLTSQGKYLSLGLAKTPADWRNAGLIFGSLGGLLTINWLVKTVGTARKDSKRKRALASLEK